MPEWQVPYGYENGGHCFWTAALIIQPCGVLLKNLHYQMFYETQEKQPKRNSMYGIFHNTSLKTELIKCPSVSAATEQKFIIY
jgi:hypothetical protein